MHRDLSDRSVLLLVGSPNSGKTTLFNWLTGLRNKTVNYPGSTVDYASGVLRKEIDDSVWTVIDTPGTYSLEPKSPEEQVTRKVIEEFMGSKALRAVVVVVDATLMSRQLLLVEQLRAAGAPVLLAVTMRDLIEKQGDEIDVKKLASMTGVPVALIDGRLGGGLKELIDIAKVDFALRDFQWVESPWSENLEKDLSRASTVAAEVLHARPRAKKNMSTRVQTNLIDRWTLHPLLGPMIFLSVMTLLFSSIFWMAAPMMDWVDGTLSSIAGFVAEISPGTFWARFLSEGVITSIASVMVFCPQIFILFLGLGLLEDSGYLARAATWVDRPLKKLGLNGRAFVPLMSGFACAVPAMMAARNINSKRERWLTLMILPLMSCSARLPVYALLLSFIFFGKPSIYAGLALAGLYIAAIVVGSVAAGFLSLWLKPDPNSFFVMELPHYRMPNWRVVFRTSWLKLLSYLAKAGPAIFAFSMIIWFATNFPNFNAEDPTVRLETSYASQAGQWIEPVFKPMGADWRVGVGLLSAFAAREVFVSSLAVVFHVTAEDEDTIREGLIETMQKSTWPDGSPLFTLASVAALLVFFMIALQCLSTTAMAKREGGSWRFALGQLVGLNLFAYVLAVAVYQILSI